jgi:chromosome segregation ATPase
MLFVIACGFTLVSVHNFFTLLFYLSFQVIIGGRNKYWINAKMVQASAIANMFHSVQLNVNNPHFLIMQGRITKVLNMKPPEILGMIEEAAGTRMFQTKKENALKTIEKKETKVEEINKVSEKSHLQLGVVAPPYDDEFFVAFDDNLFFSYIN